ncbi:DUF4258 domain-containing protein [Arvimicrobium flavum]|uniref:DUF4258 domain-containing protein n=1 Tax=Arvimicrobium flavum TaxID=3393320 RepID=UPI00237BA3B2|nr:DUF4258 domain-containing protein [Mesorhizobium shangrilense]
MENLLATIQRLVSAGKVRVSAHGFEELTEDDISFGELLEGLPQATQVEEYQDYYKGPCVLVLQTIGRQEPVHVLWGIAKNSPDEATLVTAYRPDASRWSADFLKRRPK